MPLSYSVVSFECRQEPVLQSSLPFLGSSVRLFLLFGLLGFLVLLLFVLLLIDVLFLLLGLFLLALALFLLVGLGDFLDLCRNFLGYANLDAKGGNDLLDVRSLVRVTEKQLPGLWGLVGHATKLVELALFLQLCLLLRERTKLPLLVVNVTVHDNTFGPRNNAVVTGSNRRCRHRSNC